ncbi:hypothetical protein EVAR_6996_1 [Eumeta japonica]|uniref:Uncharacterized protein n=1 Tax=Eumeta variegata TaxID=151549 RepID=A0A4C1TGM4_EUMVA|nr:hypothetical protein EVAR_6996_1 [Eumeta japonica]
MFGIANTERSDSRYRNTFLSKRANPAADASEHISRHARSLLVIAAVRLAPPDAHPQENADNHIHYGARSVKKHPTDELPTFKCDMQSCTGEYIKGRQKPLHQQPQTITTDMPVNCHRPTVIDHYPNSYRQAPNNADL